MTNQNEKSPENPLKSKPEAEEKTAPEKKNRFPTPPWQKNKPATQKADTTGKTGKDEPKTESKCKNKKPEETLAQAKEEKPIEEISENETEKTSETPETPKTGTQEEKTAKATGTPNNQNSVDYKKMAEEFINTRSELLLLKETLKNTEENLKKAKDAYIASIAEFDNYRRRTNEERPKNMLFAKGDIAKDIFPILDNFKLGLDAAKKHHPEAAEIIDGFGMIANQLKTALSNHGIVEINPVGEIFNPNEHESLSVMPSEEAPEDTVLFVHRVGYKIGERLLRPASVVIAGKPA